MLCFNLVDGRVCRCLEDRIQYTSLEARVGIYFAFPEYSSVSKIRYTIN